MCDGPRRETVDCQDPYAELIAEAAYARVLEHRIAPLPKGTIRAVVDIEPGVGLPTIAQVAGEVARAILAS